MNTFVLSIQSQTWIGKVIQALDKHLSVERIFLKNQTEYKMILFLS